MINQRARWYQFTPVELDLATSTHYELAIICMRSNAGQHLGCVPIDIPHHLNLVAFLIVVGLVDADGIYPDIPHPTMPLRLSECIVAVSCDLQLFPVN